MPKKWLPYVFSYRCEGELVNLSTKLEQLTKQIEQLEAKQLLGFDRMTILNDVPSLFDRVEILEKSVDILIGDIKDNREKVREFKIKVQGQKDSMDRSYDQLRLELTGFRSQLASTSSRISTLEADTSSAAPLIPREFIAATVSIISVAQTVFDLYHDFSSINQPAFSASITRLKVPVRQYPSVQLLNRRSLC